MNNFGYFFYNQPKELFNKDSKDQDATLKRSCKKGKIINPNTGRCVNINSPVLRKQKVIKVIPDYNPVLDDTSKSSKKVITVIKPNLLNHSTELLKKRNNLDRIKSWWLDRLKIQNDTIYPLKNLVINADYKNALLNIIYDYPTGDIDDITFSITNEHISDPDANGNHPIYIKNSVIVSINRDYPNGGKDVLVKGAILKQDIRPVIKPKILDSHDSKVLISCGQGKYINPKTKRCVQIKNKDIQNFLKRGYIFESPRGPIPTGPVDPSLITKVNMKDKNIVNDKDIKVVVPPDTSNKVKLINCGKGMVINPTTGRCIKLSGPIGKRLTSVPYIIVNPPAKPPKGPQFIPIGPKPKVGPTPKKPAPVTKQEKIRTALDTDGDGYVSIKEYLDTVESIGELEKSKSINFDMYNQRDLGITFLLYLIKQQKGPIHHIGCVPLFILCVYRPFIVSNVDQTEYFTLSNIEKGGNLMCPKTNDGRFYTGSSTSTYASIAIVNAPRTTYSDNNKMQILIPPKFESIIRKCENDNKYMVVCDLTLLGSDDFAETSHANVLIFDTKRKTIERFDPHGGNQYSDVTLAYDPQTEKIKGRQDFMLRGGFGKSKFGDIPMGAVYEQLELERKQKLNKDKQVKERKKYKSQALFNQVKIDIELKKKFEKILPDYTYYGTNITTPYLGPQVKADDFGGLCVTWSAMYMLLRLLNPDLSPAEVTTQMINGTPKELKNRILRFQKFIIRSLSKQKKDLKKM